MIEYDLTANKLRKSGHVYVPIPPKLLINKKFPTSREVFLNTSKRKQGTRVSLNKSKGTLMNTSRQKQPEILKPAVQVKKLLATSVEGVVI